MLHEWTLLKHADRTLAITQNQLQGQIITLQSTVIALLEDALYTGKISDVSKLYNASELARTGSISALQQQYQRMLQEAPLRRPGMHIRRISSTPTMKSITDGRGDGRNGDSYGERIDSRSIANGNARTERRPGRSVVDVDTRTERNDSRTVVDDDARTERTYGRGIANGDSRTERTYGRSAADPDSRTERDYGRRVADVDTRAERAEGRSVANGDSRTERVDDRTEASRDISDDRPGFDPDGPLFCDYSLDLQESARQPLHPSFDRDGDMGCPVCRTSVAVEQGRAWKIGKEIMHERVSKEGYEDEVIEDRLFLLGNRFVVKCHRAGRGFSCILCANLRDRDTICESAEGLVRHVWQKHSAEEYASDVDIIDVGSGYTETKGRYR